MNDKPGFITEPLLTPQELATAFKVDVKTVTRWAKSNRFPEGTVLITAGGHRRYKAVTIQGLLSGEIPWNTP